MSGQLMATLMPPSGLDQHHQRLRNFRPPLHLSRPLARHRLAGCSSRLSGCRQDPKHPPFRCFPCCLTFVSTGTCGMHTLTAGRLLHNQPSALSILGLC